MTKSEISTLESPRQQAIDCFWETVPPLWSRIREHIRLTAANRFDITVEQFHILRHIRLGHGSVTQLAEAKRISRPAISQAVDLLVNKGLITRTPDPHDRRVVNLELTVSGCDLLDSVFKNTRDWMRLKLENLSEIELSQICQGMQVLHGAFQDDDLER
jgi:DNA-binding MarR family transcriptional regulator